MNNYSIISIIEGEHYAIEYLGTKEKFWFKKDRQEIKQLFKIGRQNTGENWVEVVVAEICQLLDIPHAQYSFAKNWEDKLGTVTQTFVPDGGRLVHGNEILAKLHNTDYPMKKLYQVKEYVLNTILAFMKQDSIQVPLGYKNVDSLSASDMFVGYLMLDCLISNPDRHHENWGVISHEEKTYLAPTYDHASGLGCRESDHNKKKRLETKDVKFQVSHFVTKAKTPFYTKNGLKIDTLQAFASAGIHNKKAMKYWLEKLENLVLEDIREVFDRIPTTIITQTSVNFAMKILEENRKRLLQQRGLLNNV